MSAWLKLSEESSGSVPDLSDDASSEIFTSGLEDIADGLKLFLFFTQSELWHPFFFHNTQLEMRLYEGPDFRHSTGEGK